MIKSRWDFQPSFANVIFIRPGSGRAGQSGPGPAMRWPLVVGLLPRRRSLQTATILILFGICVRTLRLRDKISATPSG